MPTTQVAQSISAELNQPHRTSDRFLWEPSPPPHFEAEMNLRGIAKDLARCVVTGSKAPIESLAVFADAARGLQDQWDADRRARQQAVWNRQNPDILFVWVPKSAGTSLSLVLESIGAQRLLSVPEIQRYFENRGIVTFGHISIPALVENGLVSADFIRRCWSFSVVRNPFARAVSLYEYLRSRGEFPEAIPFSIFCELLAGGHYDDIGLFNRTALNQLNPQTRWLVGEQRTLHVDQVYKVEQVHECLAELKRRTNIPPDCSLSHQNVSRRASLADYYDSRLIELIQEAYRDDFETFGYSLVPPWIEP